MSWTFRRDLAGIKISVEGCAQKLLQSLELDFDGFAEASAGHDQISFRVRQDCYRPPAGLRQSFRGRYGVCFDDGPVRHIWYPGPVWVVYNFATDRGEIVSENLEALYERLYLSLMSRVGEFLEKRGLHRIHGLALGSPQGVCLFLMRSGVGKSQLGHALLRRPHWRLLSEDTPLLDHRGRIHPFPFRLALRGDSGEDSKTLVRASTFEIEHKPLVCTHVFSGAWVTGEEPSLGPLSKAHLLSLLLRDGVLGLGVPQVVELFLRPGLSEAFTKASFLGGRMLAILPLLKAKSQVLYLTSDGERNADLVENQMFGQAP